MLSSLLDRLLGRAANGWQRDAARHGLPYRERGGALEFPGLLFTVGRAIELWETVDARAASIPFVTGSLTGEFTPRGQQSRRAAVSFVAVPRRQSGPDAVLLGEGVGLLRQAGLGVDENRRIPIDATHTLYPAAAERRDVRFLVGRELLRTLVAYGSCDVEFAGEWVFVYSPPGRQRAAGALDRVIELARVIAS